LATRGSLSWHNAAAFAPLATRGSLSRHNAATARCFASTNDTGATSHWKRAVKPVPLTGTKPLSDTEMEEVLATAVTHIRCIIADNPEFARGLLDVPDKEHDREWLVKLSSLQQVLDSGKLNKRQGQGKTRLFALLSAREKMRILELVATTLGAEGALEASKGASGKTHFFAALPSDVKFKALKLWQEERVARFAALEAEAAKAEAAAAEHPIDEHLKQRPPNRELMKLFVANGVPMIGFGFADNFLMITFGNVIDSTFSLYVSTMAAAGLGNLCSNMVGLGLADWIESVAGRLGVPVPNLTAEQRSLFVSRAATLGGTCWGVTCGCLLGMVPLLFGFGDAEENAVLVEAIHHKE